VIFELINGLGGVGIVSTVIRVGGMGDGGKREMEGMET